MDHKNFGPMLDTFVDFASNELGIKSLPKITIQNDNESSFGGYNPATKELLTSTKNRHPMDIFRTVAHELIHHKQNEDGRIGMNIAQEGSDGSDIENEANSLAGVIMRRYAKKNPDHFKLENMTESYLIEGVNDPGIFKAVFLAGGPGSGKDFVMSQTLSPFGLVEINSDNALEFLMKKEGLDLNMPKAEEGKRNLVRGRAKSITKEKERLALQGRLGVIINGTADSVEKIAAIKSRLEELGYETKMLFVNTSNEVSQARNIERGRQGGRKVPDGTDANGIPDGSPDIRLQKWIDAQKSKLSFEEMFGKNNFTEFDNDVDLRTAPPDVVKQTKTAFTKLFKKMQYFTTSKIKSPIAKDWIKSEKQRVQQVEYETTPKNYQYGQEVVPLKTPPADVQFSFQASPREVPSGAAPSASTQVKKPVSNVPTASEKDQAQRLGLSYYGFGRYGKNINGANVVTHISQDGKLIPKPKKIQESVDINEIFSVTDFQRAAPMTDFLASDEPYSKYEPELHDHTKITSTKTHDIYWKRHPYSPDRDYMRGNYIAVNKTTGRADIKVEGSLSKHPNNKTQTFKASDLESRMNSPIKAHEFYSQIMSNPHSGRGTIIQSDNVQTLGGEKTWRRLARKKGISMHSWDDTKDVAQDFVPSRPEDREHLYSTGTIDNKFSDEMSQVRRKLADPASITDRDYQGAVEVLRKALLANMKSASELEKPSIDRTLVAYNPKTLNSIKEEKHVVTKGETIARIAMKHKTSPVLISKENGLPSIHEKLKKDQELNIPKMPKVKEEKVKPEPIVMSGVIPPEKPKEETNKLTDARARASKALQASLNAYGRKRLSEEALVVNEDLRKWFREKWVRFDTSGNIKGDCAREPGEGKPKCRPLAAAQNMTKKERAASARRKRREDPVADRKGKGGKPINVQTEQYIIEKNVPTNPELWSRAKSMAKQKFDVYPCVPMDSQAITREGVKSYDELNIGDEILTYNIPKDILEWKPITYLHFYENAPLKRIYKATGFSIRATENHKWVVRTGETYNKVSLVETKDINKRMRIVTCASLEDHTTPVLEENWSKTDSWVSKVLSWSKNMREVYLASSIVYDGHDVGASTKINDRHTFGFSQKKEDHFWAAILAAYLNGYHINFYKKTETITGASIIRNKKYHSTQNLKIEDDISEDVWCPSTENETWVMVQNGFITITGNSAYANGWASKWYKSKGGEWKSVNEANTPDDREWGTSSLVKIYRKDTPGEQVKEAVPLGHEFGNNGIGDEYGVVKSPTGLGMGYSIPMTESPDKGTDTMGLWSSPKAETDKDILETKKPRIRVARIHK